MLQSPREQGMGTQKGSVDGGKKEETEKREHWRGHGAAAGLTRCFFIPPNRGLWQEKRGCTAPPKIRGSYPVTSRPSTTAPALPPPGLQVGEIVCRGWRLSPGSEQGEAILLLSQLNPETLQPAREETRPRNTPCQGEDLAGAGCRHNQFDMEQSSHTYYINTGNILLPHQQSLCASKSSAAADKNLFQSQQTDAGISEDAGISDIHPQPSHSTRGAEQGAGIDLQGAMLFSLCMAKVCALLLTVLKPVLAKKPLLQEKYL